MKQRYIQQLIFFLFLCASIITFTEHKDVFASATPSSLMQNLINATLKILQDPGLTSTQRRDKIRPLVYERFDFTEMSKKVLGANWRGLSQQERKEFTAKFTTLLETSYVDRVDSYSGEKVIFKSEAIEGNFAKVDTTILRKTIEIPVSYRMFNNGTSWFVYDVYIEGVSLISNYRSSYDAILKKSGVKGLFANMDEHLKNPRKNNSETPH